MWKHSPTREILIAVEKARCTVQSVPGVVDGRTLKERERERAHYGICSTAKDIRMLPSGQMMSKKAAFYANIRFGHESIHTSFLFRTRP